MKEIHFTEIDSTNRYLKDNYSDIDDLTFVTADYQSAGRGRNQRIWDSQPGTNLLFSLLIRDPEFYPAYKSLSMLSAYSVLQTLQDYGMENVMIKWPNDVYVGDRKICGILLESVIREKMECLIIGIGLNVNQDSFNGEYIHPPVSMKLILNRTIDISELKQKCFTNLLTNLELLKKGHDFHKEISRYDYLKNRTVYHDGHEYLVMGINDDYSLKLSSNGQVIDVEAGEISFHD